VIETSGFCRQIQRRVSSEKAARNKFESEMMAVHHRPLLGTRYMSCSHRVQETKHRRLNCVWRCSTHSSYIAILNRSIGACPFRQTFAARTLIDVVTRRIHLRRIVWGYPQMRSKEASFSSMLICVMICIMICIMGSGLYNRRLGFSGNR